MMSYSTFGDYRRRRRRAVLWRCARFLLFVFTLGMSASYAYQVGVAASQARAHKLETDLARFQEDNLGLRERAAVAARQSEDAQTALAALRERYRQEVPHGELADLFARIQRQIEAGVPAERIALLIGAADEAAPCVAAPEVKRFVLQTPLSRGAASAVRLGSNRILVTGQGEPAQSGAGLAEAWFDPAKPVAIDFRTLDGRAEHITGALPLSHTMIVDGTEYRFSIVAGERSLVEVAAQACPLPVPEAAGAQIGAAGAQARSEASLKDGRLAF